MTKAQQAKRSEAIETLRARLSPGMTLRTILRSVSRTGMNRRVSLVLIDKDGDSWTFDYLANIILNGNDRVDNGHGVPIRGCGMDMGFELVYNLGRYLYPDGFAVEGRGRNGDTSGWDKDGGYALKQRWL